MKDSRKYCLLALAITASALLHAQIKIKEIVFKQDTIYTESTLNTAYKVKAWLTKKRNTLLLNIETNKPFNEINIETTDKAPYTAGSGQQHYNYLNSVKAFVIELDNEAFKNHMAYNIELAITPNQLPSKNIFWKCTVIRKTNSPLIKL